MESKKVITSVAAMLLTAQAYALSINPVDSENKIYTSMNKSHFVKAQKPLLETRNTCPVGPLQPWCN